MIIVPFAANIGGTTGYWSCFFALLFFGIFAGICQNTVFGMAAQFTPKYMGIVMVGNGIAGIMSNVSRLITLLIWPANGADDNAFKAALAAYGFGIVIMLLCAVC